MSASDYDFSDKVVLITGSSGGLGAHAACEFAKRSASVVITGRRAEAVEAVAEECRTLSPTEAEMLAVVGDVTKAEDTEKLINAVIDKFGRLDVLVNNAGGGQFSSIYDPNLVSVLEHMFALDVRSVVAITQLAVPHLEKTKGAIVNISSVLGQQPVRTFVDHRDRFSQILISLSSLPPKNVQFMPYCIAKSSIDMFAKCIANELGEKGVRVNNISPTAMRTNFQSATGAGGDLEQHLVQLSNLLPLRRLTTVQDVSNAILFLASDKASFITGANLAVDGGDLVR